MRYFIYCRKSSEAEDRQVASIESQLTTLKRTFGDRPDIEIIGIYEESFSAKAPGRARFGEMLSRIERREAEGIIAWAPDRLARNSIDGGRLIYMLDCSVIRDLKFATYTFENNSQGKFMLQIMLGQSKYYSDALSDNVKRGNRTKLDKGWRPNQAPLGYLNDKESKTIIADTVHFPLIRKIFDLMLSGAYTPKQIATIARDEWGFRTPKRKRIGGSPLAMSSIYKILNNPFYAGIIIWDMQTYPGKHQSVVSIDEFQAVQQLLKRPPPRRPQRRTFAFTGMIRCSTCGRWVTAEYKVNRYGSRYVYYHCSKSRLSPKCPEPSLEQDSLERQLQISLQSVAIGPDIERWMLDELHTDAERFKHEGNARQLSLERALKDVTAQLGELTSLRLRNLLSDTEFLAERRKLQQETIRLQGKLAESREVCDPVEPFREIVSFSNRAAEWFIRGDDQAKRLITGTVYSNLFLKDKELSVEAKKPFSREDKTATSPCQLGVGDDVRTLRGYFAKLAKKIWDDTRDEEGQRILHNIKLLRQRFEPETLAKELASKSRRAMVVQAAYKAPGADGSWHAPPQC